MKKLLTIILFILLGLNTANAGTVSRFFNYETTSEVTSTNLNGNFNNIINILNGDIDNTNVDTTAGYRLYEVLGTLPAAGTLGRTIFYTVDKSLNFDTGSVWYSAVTLLRPPVQGDIVYFDGTNWVVLGYGTKGKSLTTGGASANPTWEGLTTQGDIEYHNGTTRTRLAAGTSGNFLKTQGAGANPTWAAQGNLSNVIFCWVGVDNFTSGALDVGMYQGTSLIPDVSGVVDLSNLFLAVQGSSYGTVLTGRFTKILGISTVTIHAKLWARTTDITAEAVLNVDIGGQANTVKSVGSATPTWVTTSTIDVSSLTNGTVYDITIQLKCEIVDNVYCSGVMLIAS